MQICKYFGKCGGCQIQNLKYEEQLEYKINKVTTLLDKEPEEIIKSPRIYFYRNRMDWAIGRNYEVGLKEYGKWWAYVDIDECLLQSEESNQIRNKFRNFIKEKNLKPWDNKVHEGFVRYIIVREGKFTGDRMVVILLSKKENLDVFKDFYLEIKDLVTSFYIGINDDISDVSYSKDKILLFGEKYLKEKIEDNIYYILPNSFFQPNSYTLGFMINKVIEYLDPRENDIVYDLYSGIGTFSVEIAKYSKEVIGVDMELETEELFYLNSKANEVNNTKFIRDRVEKIGNIKANKIVLDPPRSGVHPKVIKLLANSGADRLVYVSCNPETFHRDLKQLERYGYKLDRYTIIDQFPHTLHVELVSLLKKNV